MAFGKFISAARYIGVLPVLTSSSLISYPCFNNKSISITCVGLNLSKTSVVLLITLKGEGYNLLNILAGAAVGKIFNLKNSKIVLSIENYIPSNNRSQLVKSSKNIIIADCYNANPTSTLESLISLNSMEGSNKIVILGDMLELGEQSENEHQLIVDFLKKNNLKSYLVGSCYNATESNFNKFENTLVLIEHLKKTNLKGNTILLKGSRGIQLEEIINQNIL